jgi:hypothetical protein
MSLCVSSAQILPSKYLLRSTNHEIPHCAVFSVLRSLLSWAHSLQHPVFIHSYWYLCVIRLPFRCSSCVLNCLLSLEPDISGQRGGPIIKGWTFDSWMWDEHCPETSGTSHPLTRLCIAEERRSFSVFKFGTFWHQWREAITNTFVFVLNFSSSIDTNANSVVVCLIIVGF